MIAASRRIFRQPGVGLSRRCKSAETSESGKVMMQHSWDAVLLGAVALIATLDGFLGEQQITAAAPTFNITVAQSDGGDTPLAAAAALPTSLTGAR
jgi:hypothetical protein